jgi:hypothetical protein
MVSGNDHSPERLGRDRVYDRSRPSGVKLMPRLLSLALVACLPVSDAGADRCVKPGSPAIARAEADALAWSERSFDAALAKRGLRPIELGRGSIELHRGIHPPSGAATAKGIPYDKATRAEIDGKRGVFIGGVSEWGGNAPLQPAWQFVENRRGEIFRVRRDPRFVDRQLEICGCAVRACGPYGSGCPACLSTAQRVYGPLPAGAVYRGELAISYRARRVELTYSRTAGCQQTRCPAPPPSMNRADNPLTD